LKKVYHQANAAQRFQLEHKMTNFNMGVYRLRNIFLVFKIFGLNTPILFM